MRALLLGSGGRESALAWALSRSSVVDDLVAAPGNPGIARHAELHDVDASDPAAVVALAAEVGAGLVVVGPEVPLVAGVGDALRAEGRLVFGPDAAAARIEGSKSYAKKLMVDAGIPTGASGTFTSVDEAVSFMDRLGPPYVVKADGLAAGKGVVVTEARAAAVAAIEERLVGGIFGDAGRDVVIEEYLDGEEASVIAFTDGRTVVPCQPAQDYKRVHDGDSGPNTGGMGSYSPVPACPDALVEQIVAEVLEPMVAATAAAGAPFSGALYAGLSLTSSGPKVIEFNARFGDPETQAILPRLESDFGEAVLAVASGDLAGVKLEWSPDACVTLVLASGGYPGPHETGFRIHGLDRVPDDVLVFHAGTRSEGEGVVTAGGRVLNLSARGKDFAEARQRAYDAARVVEFENVHYRTDIAARAVGKDR
ncbi:MAG TPA: phosphoribosylamine--glycine ligase [Actinomycetota bacterium]|nr:phosphoribosylamine--glycine ligase [Actinomycetota bacterium]